MAGLKKHADQRMSVSASELAQMGVCERLVVFEHQHGRRRTAYQQQAIERGLAAHGKLYRDRHLDSVRQVRRRPTFPSVDGHRLSAIWCQTVRVIHLWLGKAFRLRSGINFCLRALDWWCIGRQAQTEERNHERR